MMQQEQTYDEVVCKGRLLVTTIKGRKYTCYYADPEDAKNAFERMLMYASEQLFTQDQLDRVFETLDDAILDNDAFAGGAKTSGSSEPMGRASYGENQNVGKPDQPSKGEKD
jgi:hypothetical protein